MGGRWVVTADRYVGAAIEHFVMLPVDEQEQILDSFLRRYPGMTKPGLRTVRTKMAQPLDDEPPPDEKPKRKPGRPRKQGPGTEEK
jgi:hypothetical protein